MSLKIHYAVVRDTLAVLQTADFTRTNVQFGGGGSAVPLGADFPDGQLGGHVAVHTGSFEIGVMTDPDTEPPLGLFINDAAGSPFENTPAVGSGKSPFVSGAGSVVEVDIFEVWLADNSTPITYAAGDLVWGSPNGLVTNENPTPPPAGVFGEKIIGTVYRTPGTAGLLGVRLRN